MDQQIDRDEHIRARAYALWEQDGKPDGMAEHHWHQAKAELADKPTEPGPAVPNAILSEASAGAVTE